MKVRMLSSILLLTIVLGCQRSTDIGPADLLYKRWHIDRVRNVDENVWISYDTDGYYDTEYRPDGALINRKNGIIQSEQCCVPIGFEGNGNVIRYTKFPSCPFSLCASVPQQATITMLRSDLLELTDGQRVTQYNVVK